MPQLTVTNRAGVTRIIEAAVGSSLMETLRNAGYDELTGLCGGCCSCATCHVHVDEPFVARLSAPTQDESDLLEGSTDRAPGSRLSCQIPVTDALDGIRVTIAKED